MPPCGRSRQELDVLIKDRAPGDLQYDRYFFNIARGFPAYMASHIAKFGLGETDIFDRCLECGFSIAAHKGEEQEKEDKVQPVEKEKTSIMVGQKPGSTGTSGKKERTKRSRSRGRSRGRSRSRSRSSSYSTRHRGGRRREDSRGGEKHGGHHRAERGRTEGSARSRDRKEEERRKSAASITPSQRAPPPPNPQAQVLAAYSAPLSPPVNLNKIPGGAFLDPVRGHRKQHRCIVCGIIVSGGEKNVREHLSGSSHKSKLASTLIQRQLPPGNPRSAPGVADPYRSAAPGEHAVVSGPEGIPASPKQGVECPLPPHLRPPELPAPTKEYLPPSPEHSAPAGIVYEEIVPGPHNR